MFSAACPKPSPGTGLGSSSPPSTISKPSNGPCSEKSPPPLPPPLRGSSRHRPPRCLPNPQLAFSVRKVSFRGLFLRLFSHSWGFLDCQTLNGGPPLGHTPASKEPATPHTAPHQQAASPQLCSPLRSHLLLFLRISVQLTKGISIKKNCRGLVPNSILNTS